MAWMEEKFRGINKYDHIVPVDYGCGVLMGYRWM
jgi:hypothetical protein